MYDFIVIGAGPAGIAAVGELLDKKKSIVWIDPAFTVGRLQHYRNVPSNTKVKHFVEYLTGCESFEGYRHTTELFDLDPDSTCQLGLVVDELQSLTNFLRKKTFNMVGKITDIRHKNPKMPFWETVVKIGNTDLELDAFNIVVATGAEPRTIKAEDFFIPFDLAIDPYCLRTYTDFIESDYRYVVHGDSHSAMLILHNLYNCPSIEEHQIVNVYKNPKFRFAEYLPDGSILYDNTGLKGDIAVWVRDVYAKSSPNRVSTDEYICQENDIPISAIGFQPVANIWGKPRKHSAMYEFGIGAPELIETPTGPEKNVGMIKFMRHIKKTFANL